MRGGQGPAPGALGSSRSQSSRPSRLRLLAPDLGQATRRTQASPVLPPFSLKKSGKPNLSQVEDPRCFPASPRAHLPVPHGVSGCGAAELQSCCGSAARGEDVAEFREECEL